MKKEDFLKICRSKAKKELTPEEENFFGSIGDFEKALDVKHDPAHVVIDLQHSSISDMGALESLNKMTGKYQAVGKTLVLENLDAQSQALLQKAANLSAVRLA